MNLENKRYHRKSGWLPYIEIAIGTYFVAMIAFAIDTNNFFFDSVSAVLRGRVLLGGLGFFVPGAPMPPPGAETAAPGTENCTFGQRASYPRRAAHDFGSRNSGATQGVEYCCADHAVTVILRNYPLVGT